ncbi:unnamed protein product [Caretta caretta]
MHAKEEMMSRVKCSSWCDHHVGQRPNGHAPSGGSTRRVAHTQLVLLLQKAGSRDCDQSTGAEGDEVVQPSLVLGIPWLGKGCHKDQPEDPEKHGSYQGQEIGLQDSEQGRSYSK